MDDPGDRRCVAHNRRGERCGKWAIRGATVCLAHGGAVGPVRRAAEQRVQEQKAAEPTRRSLDSVDLERYKDPVAALKFSVAQSHALAVRLAQLVGQIPDDQLRYQGKVGEQLRGEVTALQKALDDSARIATAALKLNLEARRVGIRQATADMLEKALNAALERAGLGVDGQAAAPRRLPPAADHRRGER